MSMGRSVFLLLFILFLSVVLTSEVQACRCGERPTVAEELAKSKVVVTGSIESVRKLRDEERQGDYQAYLSATLVVEKVYSGKAKVGDKLVLEQSNGDCRFTWSDLSVGSRLLLYLGEPSTDGYSYIVEDEEVLAAIEKVPMYEASTCGRSIYISGAARDLAYLNDLRKLKGRTRLSGDLEYDRASEEASVEGIEVLISGKQIKRRTKYLKEGFFEVYDLPPGDYLVDIKPPAGWKIGVHWRSWNAKNLFPAAEIAKLGKNQKLVRVPKGGHADVNLSLIPDTMISGRVLSGTGKPASEVCVAAVSDQGEEKVGGGACTDKKGDFTIESLRPGNYFLIANPDGKIGGRALYGKVFYPGVTKRENAGAVSVEAGKYNRGLEFQIIETVSVVEISGRVFFADNNPSPRVLVEFRPKISEQFSEISEYSEEDGTFTLKIPAGAEGSIQGSHYFSENDYSHCSEILEAAKAADSRSLSTGTELIPSKPNSLQVVLKFSFAFCAKGEQKP